MAGTPPMFWVGPPWTRFHLCSVIPRRVGQRGPGPELCRGNGLGPRGLTLGKADPYLPLEATGYFHCLFAGTARTAWTISQAWGVEGPPTFHKAHRAPRRGLEGGTHHCRLDSLRHIITLKQDSCIKQLPPGPTHAPSLCQALLHGSPGGGPLVALLSAQPSHTGAQPKTWDWLGVPSPHPSILVTSKITRDTRDTKS